MSPNSVLNLTLTEDAPQIDVAAINKARGNNKQFIGHETKNVSLEEIKAIAGSIPMPDFVPEGYELIDARITFQHHISLRYSDGEGALLVRQSPKANLRVPPSFIDKVSLAQNSEGYLMRGAWYYPPHGKPMWMEALSLAIVFERNERVVMVSATGKKLLDAGTLIAVAASLRNQ